MKSHTVGFAVTCAGLIVGILGLIITWVNSLPPGYIEAGTIHVEDRALVQGGRLEFDVSIINPGGRPVENLFSFTDVVFYTPEFPGQVVTKSVQSQLRAMALKKMQDAINAAECRRQAWQK